MALRNRLPERWGWWGQEGQDTYDFGEAGVHAIQHIFFRTLQLISRSFANHEAVVTMKEGFYCFFQILGDTKIGHIKPS